MLNTLLIILGVLAGAALVLILLHFRYSNRPATAWKWRVQTVVAEWDVRKLSLTRPTDISPEVRDLALRGEYFARHLRSISVDHLLNYSGIGPVTVLRLREAGFTDLNELSRGNFPTVPGLGPAREKDLLAALQHAKREAKNQFDAGACPAAVAMLAEKNAQKVERTRQHDAAREDLKEVEAAFSYLAEPIRVAAEITFMHYLARRPVAGLSEKLLARSLTPPPFLRVAKLAPVEVAPAPAIAVAHVPPVDESALDRLRAVAGFGFAVAKFDGRIAVGERRQIRVFLERRYASTNDLRLQIDQIAKAIEKDVPGLDRAIAEVRRTIPASALVELHQFAASVVDASGQRNAREEQCLARIAESLGLTLEPSKPVATAQIGNAGSWTEIDCRTMLEIGIETPLNVELIRRQYYLLAERFAPTRFDDHGAEFVAMAATKRAQVERAARQLMAAFNAPLESPATQQPTDLRHNPDLDAVFG